MPQEAVSLQKTLQANLVLEDNADPIRCIAVADISYSKKTNFSYSGVAVFPYPGLELLEEYTAFLQTDFPYVPGLLSFREGPVALEAFRQVELSPDVILFDGQGIAHPRRFGFAAHLGLLLDKPSIGYAKSKLYGRYIEP